jgi:hypothetical protein
VFRSSIKWILALVAYFALATAAFQYNLPLLTDFLVGIAFLAFVFAVLCGFAARGDMQIRALGFAIAFATLVGYEYVQATTRSPAWWLTLIVQRFQADELDVSEVVRDQLTAERPSAILSVPVVAPFQRRRPSTSAVNRTAQTVLPMFAGGVGYGLGALAYRQASRQAK